MDKNIYNINLENLSFNVNEIFYSIQGEGTLAGLPCVFIRLQGCELRCSWCDTPYALEIKSEQIRMNGKEIAERIDEYKCKLVLFTGGEPLNQQNVTTLMDHLIGCGYSVTLETNGHLDISKVNPLVKKVMDLKCPSSGMDSFNKFENFQYLTNIDELKCVIADREDYEFAKKIIEKFEIVPKVESVLFSPVFGKIEPREIVQWILEDGLQVRFQLQLHKLIWDPDTRGV